METLKIVRTGNFNPLETEIVTNDDVPYAPRCQLGVKDRPNESRVTHKSPC
jgi:hypothetical protein